MHVLTHILNNAEDRKTDSHTEKQSLPRHTSKDRVNIWLLSPFSGALGLYIRGAQNNILHVFVKLLCALKTKESQGKEGQYVIVTKIS